MTTSDHDTTPEPELLVDDVLEGIARELLTRMERDGVADRFDSLRERWLSALLRAALRKERGRVARAAAFLGIPERTLRRKMRDTDVRKEAFKARRAPRRKRGE